MGWWAIAGPASIGAWVGLAFLSVLVHELGHAVAYRSYGKRAAIRLWAMGGLTTGESVSPGRHIVVSAAGPATGLVIGVAVLLFAGFPGDTVTFSHVVNRDAVWINVGWALFNLLPTLPLDGGNILANSISLVTKRNDRRLALQISVAVMVGVGVYCLRIHQLYLALFCAALTVNNVRLLRAPAAINQTNTLRRGLDALAEGHLDQARNAADRAFSARDSNAVSKAAAVELLAWTDLAERHVGAAVGRLEQLSNAETEPLLRWVLDVVGGGETTAAGFGLALLTCTEPSLLGIAVAIALEQCDPFALGASIDAVPDGQAPRAMSAYEVGLHMAGFYGQAAEIGAYLYLVTNNPQSAYNAAVSYARAGDQAKAVVFLRAAISRGIDPHTIEREPQLNSLHGLPEFEQLRPS